MRPPSRDVAGGSRAQGSGRQKNRSRRRFDQGFAVTAETRPEGHPSAPKKGIARAMETGKMILIPLARPTSSILGSTEVPAYLLRLHQRYQG